MGGISNVGNNISKIPGGVSYASSPGAISILPNTISWPSLDPAAAALIARMSPAPSAARAIVINNLIVALKAADIWAYLDILYITAAFSSQSARLNWINSSYTLTPVSAPTFVVDRGYSGDGSTNYLDTGYVPSGNMQQNNSHMGYWCLTDLSATMFDLGNAFNTMIGRDVGGNLRVRARSNSTPSNSVPSSIGYSIWSRNASNSYFVAKNGSVLSTYTDASTAGIGSALWICGKSDSTVGYSTRQIAAAHGGASLTSQKATLFYSALNTYMQAVGAA